MEVCSDLFTLEVQEPGIRKVHGSNATLYGILKFHHLLALPLVIQNWGQIFKGTKFFSKLFIILEALVF